MSEYTPYHTAALDVSDTISSRDSTHGDPIAFATCYAGLVNAYLRHIVSAGRLVSPADALVLLDLMKTARIAVGGPQADHFRDKAGYGVIGLVHVSAVLEQGRAQAAEQAEAAKEPPLPDEVLFPDEALHNYILNPIMDVWADLLEPAEPGQSAAERLYRPGVTKDMLQARFGRVHGFLDGKSPPEVPFAIWDDARKRVLPLVYGDKA